MPLPAHAVRPLSTPSRATPVRGRLLAWLALFVWVLGASLPPARAETDEALPFWGDAENWAAILADSLGKGVMLRPGELGAELDRETAFAVQLELFPMVHGAQGRGGFKAGLTNLLSRYQFGTDEPIAGLLPKAGRLGSGSAIAFRPGVLVEAELGFRLGTTLERPVTGGAALRGLVASVHPVLELPRLPFADGVRPTEADLIAANAGADRYIVGPALPFADLEDVNSVYVDLRRDGRTETLGKAMNVEPDQFEALAFLVNSYLNRGLTITPEDLLITGPMTRIRPLTRGRWEAEYRGLATLSVTVK